MIEIRFAEGYEKKAVRFFKKHKDLYPQYRKTLEILSRNPCHPSLRLHKLRGKLSGLHSVSINMKYRVVLDFIIRDDVVILIDIGSHSEVY